MSLDVYLTLLGQRASTNGSGIFVREDGQRKEISRAEWDEKHPGREPVVYHGPDASDEVYSANITHNLNAMADAAGIYKPLWRPEEIGITHARQLIEPLRNGLIQLRSDPARFKMFDADNGWGTYEQFVPWVEKYLAACEQYPDAEVSVSR